MAITDGESTMDRQQVTLRTNGGAAFRLVHLFHSGETENCLEACWQQAGK
jgi:hypothetical protein